MGSSPTPQHRRRSAIVTAGITLAFLAASFAVPAQASADSVADASRRLAADTDRLATASTKLEKVRDELRTVTRRRARMRVQIEARLVSIYKSGGSIGALTGAAAAGSVREVGTSLDTLEVVARHESRSVAAWNKLVKRHQVLAGSRTKLERTVTTAKQAVRRGRARLSRAEAEAARAREAARRMAEIADSPVLPRVGHPETNATRTASGNDDEALSVQEQPIGFSQTGVASMYHDSFTGEETANGEHYDPNAFTAAHPSLPFGSWVTVAGPGGTIAVRINDRGPFVGGRVIDLSRAAAAAVGIMGIGQVTLSVQA